MTKQSFNMKLERLVIKLWNDDFDYCVISVVFIPQIVNEVERFVL